MRGRWENLRDLVPDYRNPAARSSSPRCLSPASGVVMDEFAANGGHSAPLGTAYASTTADTAKRTRRSCEGVRISATETGV